MILTEYRRLLGFCAWSGDLQTLEQFCFSPLAAPLLLDTARWLETWFLLAALLVGRYACDAGGFAGALRFLRTWRTPASPEELARAAVGNRERLHELEFIRVDELGTSVLDAAVLGGLLGEELFGVELGRYKDAVRDRDSSFFNQVNREVDRLRRERPAWVEGLLAELERWAYGGCEGV
jgi:hypothetical protein